MDHKEFYGRDNKPRAYIGNTQNNEYSNPCLKEHQLSLQCLERNSDRDACKPYFVNYKTCRKFWDEIIKQRREDGLKPYLPFPEDRAEIKAKALSGKR